MNTPIIQTKVYQPKPTGDVVRRESLIDRLESAFDLPLTVISAPAGYGKSTLISDWLGSSGRPAAWLSLDESDSDLRVFLAYFIAAIRTIAENSLEQLERITQGKELPDPVDVAAYLSNDLEQLATRVVLVLDDYHRLRNPDVHTVLDRLLDHPSPKLHLVIAARRDPFLSLARLEGKNLLNQVRMGDLQFSEQDTAEFLGGALDGSVAQSIIDRAFAVTEGWPAGMRFVALAARQQDNPESYLASFESGPRQIRRFFLDEVLARQPPQVLCGLLAISVLDRFNPDLCDALFDGVASDGDCPGDARQFVVDLEQAGLFCIALDDTGHWHRLHHLFQELLQQRLLESKGQQVVNKLHQLASRWFAANGFTEDAIRHALVAHDVDSAVAVLEAGRARLMVEDEWPVLERWVRLFPAEARTGYPELLVLSAWLALNRLHDFDQMDRDLVLAGNLLETSVVDREVERRLWKEIAVIRSALDLITGDAADAIVHSDEAVTDTATDLEFARSTAEYIRAGALLMQRDSRGAESLLRNALQRAQQQSPHTQARILHALCFVYWYNADANRLERTATRLLMLSREIRNAWCESMACYFLGCLHYERDELAKAVSYLEQVVNEPFLYPAHNVLYCSILLGLVYLAQQDFDRARQVAESLLRFSADGQNEAASELADALNADIESRTGHAASAEHWLQGDFLMHPQLLFRIYSAPLARVRVLARSDTDEKQRQALDSLSRLLAYVDEHANLRLKIDILGLRAEILGRQGKTDAALEELGEAVRIGQPGQIVRPLADVGGTIVRMLNQLNLDEEGLRYVGKIIAAVNGAEPSTETASNRTSLPESLSPRELEILALMAASHSNREIGEILFISEGTVKRHAHNIYSKLAVRTRGEAVSKASGLGLL